ncbi:MAG: hypothetical protein ACXAEI_17480 [Candidatus Hodarchaeales archaeon]|jgi:hypothetical protein
MKEHDYETEIIAEILAFWEKIPNSSLQELTSKVDTPKTAKLWEKHAMLFFQRFGSQPANSNIQVSWDDEVWKYYRSVWVEDRHSGTFVRFPYPIKCFQIQGLNRTFYEELIRQWTIEPDKSLRLFLEIIFTKYRSIFADLNSSELSCLKAAARSINDLAAQDFWKTDLAIYKYYREKTGLSGDLAHIFCRLLGHGILTARTMINFAKIGLKPYLLITSRDLEKFEQDYCFFHVESPDAGTDFIGLAMPEIAGKIGWPDDRTKEDDCLEIWSFSAGWNLSQLSTAGWQDLPATLLEYPTEKGFGQITLDFHTTPIELWASDGMFLERVQDNLPKHAKGEIGKDGRQRLQELAAMGVIHPAHMFSSIQVSSGLAILYARGPTASLDKLQRTAYHFPRFRILRGTNWILAAIKMPPSWVSPAITSLQDLASELPLADLVIDVDHRFAAEHFLQFSKLWDPEKKTWVIWDS